ncbi:MAG: hypothetical protein M3O55_10515 [Actinomycetota bacterium]|nr:hypothetical protein [Actinomycetota bacterium]
MTSDPPSAARRTRRFAPLAAVLLVLAVVGGTALAIRATRGSGQAASSGGTPVLRLTTNDGLPEAQKGSLGNPMTRHYVLTGTLPAGRPGNAPIYRFGGGRPPMDAVRRLAGVLGLAGTPTRDIAGWRLTSGGRELAVFDGPGWPWQLNDSVGRVMPHTVCVPAPCPGPAATDDPMDPVRGLRPPTTSSAKHAATKVLTALGQPAADLRTNGYGGVVQVGAPRRVAGKEAVDLGTVLVIGGDDRVQSGAGWLGAAPKAGPSYPLIGAAEAFKRLQVQMGPLSMDCPSGCPMPATGAGEQKITGARLGLMISADERGSLLVPAWLFTMARQAQPIPVIAVDSRYLGRIPRPIIPSSGIAVPNGRQASLPPPKR